MKNIVAALAVGCIASVVGAAGFDGKSLTTNDWFDADFTTGIVVGSAVVANSTTGITYGAGSWTAVPATGTAVIAADADAGGAATLLAIAAPDEELTFTPAALATTSGLETVSAEIKADAIDELPALGADVQGAFTVYLDGNDVLSAQGWTAAGWTNLVYAAVGSLTNAWFTLSLDFAKEGGVRYVRYSVKPAAGALAVLADADGATWFQAGKNADVVSSMSFSGIGSVRAFSGDELEVLGVATYNGVPYQTFEAAIAAGVADGWANGNVTLFDDATWTPTATGTYNIDVNGHTLAISGVNGTWAGTTYTVSGYCYYWVGEGETSNWSESANWSCVSAGATLGYPQSSEDAVVFDKNATLVADAGLSGSYTHISNWTIEDGVTVTLSTASGVSVYLKGSVNTSETVNQGTLKLSGSTISAASAQNVTDYIYCALEIADGTSNTLKTANSEHELRLYGDVKGGGNVVFNAAYGTKNGNNDGKRSYISFYCSFAAFTGEAWVTMVNQYNKIQMKDIRCLDSSGATWHLYETGETPRNDNGKGQYKLYSVGNNAVYKFGALNGVINTCNSDNSGMVFQIGSKNEDCGIWGTLGTIKPKIDWVASSATFTYALTNRSSVVVSGGGVVEFATEETYPTTLAFTNNAGFVRFATGVTGVDISSLIANSDAAIGFDDNGVDYTWTTPIAASNTGGFKKKGSGTLTLTAAPAYTGGTTVENGVLIVPGGTSLGDVVTGAGAYVLVNGLDGETVTVDSVEGGKEIDDVVRMPVGTSVAWTQDSGTGVWTGTISRSPLTFTWTDATGDHDWSTAGNWTIGEDVASTAPLAIDTALFPAGEVWTTVLSSQQTVTNLTVNGDTTISGALIQTGEVFGDGKITLGDAAGFCTYTPYKSTLTISNDIEIAATASSTNTFKSWNAGSAEGSTIYLYGDLTGRGTVCFTGPRLSCSLRGDNSEFAGVVYVEKDANDRNGTHVAAESAASTNAIRNVNASGNGNFTQVQGGTFRFGSLNGSIAYADQSNNKYQTIEVGHLGLDDALGGAWFPSTYKNLVVDSNLGDRTDNSNRGHCLRKVGDGTLTFSGRYLRKFEMNGGTLLITNDESFVWTNDETTYRSRFTFGGGTLAFGEGVTGDPSSRIVGSAAPICFSNAVGEVHTWATALDASNVGGLVKKGEGTLILSAKPAYTGTTYLDGGVLKMPRTVRVLTHNEDKSVYKSFEDIDGVTYTVYTLDEKRSGTMVILF